MELIMLQRFVQDLIRIKETLAMEIQVCSIKYIAIDFILNKYFVGGPLQIYNLDDIHCMYTIIGNCQVSLVFFEFCMCK